MVDQVTATERIRDPEIEKARQREARTNTRRISAWLRMACDDSKDVHQRIVAAIVAVRCSRFSMIVPVPSVQSEAKKWGLTPDDLAKAVTALVVKGWLTMADNGGLKLSKPQGWGHSQ